MNPNPLPFSLDASALAAHKGIAGCSAAAATFWLQLLAECFCERHLHVTAVDRIADRLHVGGDMLRPLVIELARHRVCQVTPAGDLVPLGADYLAPDFWAQLRAHHGDWAH